MSESYVPIPPPKYPDTSGFVDLTLFDKTAQEVYEDAFEYLKWMMPEWEPVETNTENALMQALALMVGEAMFTINRLPSAMLETLLLLYGVLRETGTPPSVSATFTAVDADGHTIPAGLEVLIDLQDGGDPMIFVLSNNVVIPAGQTTGVGVLDGTSADARFNKIPAGTQFTVVTPVSYLLSITSNSLVTGGIDPEDDSLYFDRATIRLNRLSEVLVLPRHFESFATDYNTNIRRVKTLDRYEPGVGISNGHFAVYVYGDEEPITSSEQVDLEYAMTAASLPGLTIHVSGPDAINILGVSVTVKRTPIVLPYDLQQSVAEAINNYLSTETWPWDTVLRWTNLVAVIEGVPGVDYITSLSINVNKVPLVMFSNDGASGTWAAVSNATVSYDAALSDDSIGGSLKVVATANGNVLFKSGDDIATEATPLTAGDDYIVSIRGYVEPSATGRVARIGMEWYNAANTLISSSELASGPTIQPGQWIEVSDTFTAPANTAKGLVYVEIDAAIAAQIFHFDRLIVGDIRPVNTDVTLTGVAPLIIAGRVAVTVVS